MTDKAHDGSRAMKYKGLCVAFLLLVMAHGAFAVSPNDDAHRVSSAQSLILEREDSGRLVLTSTDDPIIELVEVGGTSAVVRLALIDNSGLQLGPGRIVVVPPFGARTVRLRDELPSDLLSGLGIRIESLRETGRVNVTVTDRSESRLRQRVDAASGRRRAARPGRGTTPASETLIDTAESSGQLDSETALVYRVYALFGDGRLPAPYRGDDGGVRDSVYMAEVQGRFPTLSPATQALVQPFLTPPAYRGSWASLSRPSVSGSLPPPCQFLDFDTWHFVDTTNNFVRIWYRADVGEDFLAATRLAREIDSTIWPQIALVLPGHLPRSDIGKQCNGDSGRLDIYFAEVETPVTIPFEGCSNAPAFITLRPGDDRSMAAHEIFHAFQYSYPLKQCFNHADYRWWAEASAEWAMDRVYPRDQAEFKSAAKFTGFPDKPLDLHENPHWFGAYLFPFFVYRKTGSAGFVSAAWEGCKDRPALEALNGALTGGFKDVWPEFVLRNWNRPPMEDYKNWDGLTTGTSADDLDVTLAAQPDAALAMNYRLPHLSAKYFHFTFDDTTSTVAFWNGAKNKLALRPLSVFGVGYLPEAATEQETKGIGVTALIKMEFQDWKTEQWTDRPFVAYCRDMADERIKELILIYSNSEFEDRSRELRPPGLAPVLWVSNMGCWQWQGNATHVDRESGEKITTQVTWTRTSPPASVPLIQYQPDGTENWSFSGDCSGSGSLPISKTVGGGPVTLLSTYNFIPSAGTHYRSYVGEGGEARSVSVNCQGATLPMSLNDWFRTPDQPIFTGIPDARFVQVSPNGKVMDGSYTPTFSEETWSWHLESKRQ